MVVLKRRLKTLKDYEDESSQQGECLITPRLGAGIARSIYEMRHGPIGSRLIYVCHTCDNPRCIRDEHHFLGTPAENMKDAKQKGRLVRTHSEEHRKHLSEAAKKRFKNPSERKKISDGGKRRFGKPEERLKQSKAQRLRFDREKINENKSR